MKVIKDYLNISQILDMSKYQKTLSLRSFKNQRIIILSATPIISNNEGKTGFKLEIQNDLENDKQVFIVNTFSRCVVEQINELLSKVSNVNGKFEKCLCGTVNVEGFKGKNNEYKECFKLV